MVCCFPPISPHYTDIPQRTLRIFSQIIFSVLDFIALSCNEGGDWWVCEALYQICTLSVCDLQLRHGKRGIRAMFHFSPISH